MEQWNQLNSESEALKSAAHNIPPGGGTSGSSGRNLRGVVWAIHALLLRTDCALGEGTLLPA